MNVRNPRGSSTPGASPAVLGRARRWHPHLVDRHLADVIQVAHLVAQMLQMGPGLGGVWESRLADRELYRLSRELGYRRPAAGLSRGRTGRWVQDAVPMDEEENA